MTVMAPLAPTIHADAAAVARAAGYSKAELLAGFMFFRRKNRIDNPPGVFDRARRFTAAERTEAVRTCRAPSRAYPWPEMQAARTARHCAEVVGDGAVVLHVKRIAKAMEASRDGAGRAELEKILKTVKPPTPAMMAA